ncbi:hypothetical protein NSQ59_27675 [Margalitia sp. FSL K6-0131]|uniref:hypothetical protein n=1 Tax=Margalitia sp. FSL K6-0131 TaxID=2954604 RepID=UPI0030FCEB0F
MKKQLNILKELFSGWAIFGYIVTFFLLCAIYFYVISNNLLFTILSGIIGSVFILKHFTAQNKKIKKELYLLTELNKYSSSIAFFLQTGKNVLYALEETKELVDPQIQKDIQKTIDTLRNKGQLDISHFKKYNFSALDVFHKTLQIKYEQGGNAKDMFKQPNKDINFEITSRDELWRRKTFKANQVYAMYGIVLLTPIGMKFFVKNLYSQFLNLSFSGIICFVFFVSILVSVLYLQRQKGDISLKL